MSSKRLFVGTMLPAQSQSQISALRESIEGTLTQWWDCKLRWVRPEKLHITWLFFGDCNAEQEAQILEKLEALAGKLPQTELAYEQFEIFYSHKRPNAAVLIPETIAAEMQTIASTLRNELGQHCQKSEEPFSFRPHLTLFRFPRDNKTRFRMEGELDFSKHLPLLQEIKQFSLIESHTGGQGTDYIAIKSFKLGSCR